MACPRPLQNVHVVVVQRTSKKCTKEHDARESILGGLSETFGSRSIFLAHDNAGSKFDKHPFSIDFTGYKNTNKLIV